MNVMAEAHKRTKAFIAKGECLMTYAAVLRVTLRHCHSENKAMNQAQQVMMLKADTIAKFEQRIIELNEAGAQYGHKWMVVCGDEHPMPVNMHAENPKWPWCKVEDATFWSHEKWAALEAVKVVNGNRQVGKAVLVDDHIKWDIAQLQKLIAAIKTE